MHPSLRLEFDREATDKLLALVVDNSLYIQVHSAGHTVTCRCQRRARGRFKYSQDEMRRSAGWEYVDQPVPSRSSNAKCRFE